LFEIGRKGSVINPDMLIFSCKVQSRKVKSLKLQSRKAAEFQRDKVVELQSIKVKKFNRVIV
jgi:hypothetical protein